MIKLKRRSFTAIFTIMVPKDITDEKLAEELAHFQDHFDTQWAHTGDTEEGWTLTIHADDEVK